MLPMSCQFYTLIKSMCFRAEVCNCTPFKKVISQVLFMGYFNIRLLYLSNVRFIQITDCSIRVAYAKGFCKYVAAKAYWKVVL